MKYFSIRELCSSQTAARYHQSNEPSKEVRAHLQELIEKLLDPLRTRWQEHCEQAKLGSPALIVSSGYRSPWLNRKVGGVSNSAHLHGYAADIVPANGKQREFEAFVSSSFANSGVRYDQIIIERKGASRWVHLAVRHPNGQQRGHCFRLNVSL